MASCEERFPPRSEDPPLCWLRAFHESCGKGERICVIVSATVFEELYDQIVWPNTAEEENTLEVDGITIRKRQDWTFAKD